MNRDEGEACWNRVEREAGWDRDEGEACWNRVEREAGWNRDEGEACCMEQRGKGRKKDAG